MSTEVLLSLLNMTLLNKVKMGSFVLKSKDNLVCLIVLEK